MPAPGSAGKRPEPGPDPWEKIAVLMVALGQDLAGDLLRQFDDEDAAQITRAIAGLKNVSARQQDDVLSEFEDELRSGRLPAVGGADFARRLLERALGQERGTEVWRRLQGPQRSAFKALDAADPDQAAPYIRREHPQTIALILSQLSPAQSAAILARLPADVQAEVAHRIATLERVSPAILEQVEAGLADTLQRVLSGQQPVGGARVAADILNRVGSRLEKSLLDRLDAADPEVAEQVRQRLFTFEDIARLSDRDARALVERVDAEELLVSLKAAGKDVLDRILSAVSERRRAQMLEDLGALPRMRMSEVESARLRVVQQLRRLEAQGLVDLRRPADDETWVGGA